MAIKEHLEKDGKCKLKHTYCKSIPEMNGAVLCTEKPIIISLVNESFNHSFNHC